MIECALLFIVIVGIVLLNLLVAPIESGPTYGDGMFL